MLGFKKSSLFCQLHLKKIAYLLWAVTFFIIITYLYDIVSENWIQVVGDINIKKNKINLFLLDFINKQLV